MKTHLIFILLTLCMIDVANATEHFVKVMSGKKDEMRFEPEELEVKVGDTVTWENQFNVYHNIKSLTKDVPEGATPLKSPGLKKKGEKWSYKFEVPGIYNYFCVPHRAMGMVGKITAKE